MSIKDFIKNHQKKEVIHFSEFKEDQEIVVSVCVQTYQHANFIKECLDGILMQETNFPFEILLGDDESTDGTREICIEYAEKYPDKIRLFLHHRENNIKINGIPTGRFNFLYNLYNARGKYIALCEGDDYWTDPLKLQKQVDFLEGNLDYVLVFTNGRVNYDNKNFEQHLIYRNTLKKDGEYNAFKIPADTTDISILANGNYIHTAGVVFTNWIKVEGIPDYLRETTIGDWPIHMKTAAKGLIKFMNDDTFSYRVHNGGLFSKQTIIEKYKMTLGQFPSILKSDIFSAEIKTIIKNYCKRSSVVYHENLRSEKDFNYFIYYAQSFSKENSELSADLLKIAEKYKSGNKISNNVFFYSKGQIKKIIKYFIN